MLYIFPLLIITISTLLFYLTYKEKTEKKIEDLNLDLTRYDEEKNKLEIKYHSLLNDVKKQDDLKKAENLEGMQVLFTKVNMLDDKLTYFNTTFKTKLEEIFLNIENLQNFIGKSDNIQEKNNLENENFKEEDIDKQINEQEFNNSEDESEILEESNIYKEKEINNTSDLEELNQSNEEAFEIKDADVLNEDYGSDNLLNLHEDRNDLNKEIEDAKEAQSDNNGIVDDEINNALKNLSLSNQESDVSDNQKKELIEKDNNNDEFGKNSSDYVIENDDSFDSTINENSDLNNNNSSVLNDENSDNNSDNTMIDSSDDTRFVQSADVESLKNDSDENLDIEHFLDSNEKLGNHNQEEYIDLKQVAKEESNEENKNEDLSGFNIKESIEKLRSQLDKDKLSDEEENN